MSALKLGDRAPHFTLNSSQHQPVALADFIGKKNVVLFFYPKDETPGCTAEACGFRDSYDEFVAAGAEVIGISSDSVDSHARFASRHALPMLMLSDPGSQVRKLYGVRNTLGLIPGRETFIIDKQGVVRHRFASQFQALQHVAEALEVLKRLDAEAPAHS